MDRFEEFTLVQVELAQKGDEMMLQAHAAADRLDVDTKKSRTDLVTEWIVCKRKNQQQNKLVTQTVVPNIYRRLNCIL